jgi:SulP family sulfate permease
VADTPTPTTRDIQRAASRCARADWMREIGAGAAGAITVAAVPITLGVLVYAPLGAAAGPLGIPAAFWSVAIAGVVALCISNARMPAIGPTSATALPLAALVAQIAADPRFDAAQASHVAALVAAASSAVLLMGVMMVVFGALRLGALISYVPRPVLSGFMNGVALLIVVSQLPALLGIDARAWSAGGPASWAALQPATVAIGVVTLVVAWAVSQWRPQWPVTLVALAFGTLLYHAAAAVAPQWPLGGLAGVLRDTVPTPDALQPLLGGGAALLRRHGWAIVATAAVLAVIGSLESLLSVAALDLQLDHRTDPNRDLLAVGAGNVVGAFFGALPSLQLRVRALALVQFGGRTRLAASSGALVSLALVAGAAPLLSQLPRVVLAAVMIWIAWTLADRWAWQLAGRWRAGDRTPDLLPSIGVTLAVLLVTVFAGFVVAVALGVLLSMVLFIRSVNRSLIRGRWQGEDRRSRRIYAAAQEQALAGRRRLIEGMVVEGVLYFGSQQALAATAERLRPGTRFWILDLQRVSTIEASGVSLLLHLAQRLRARGVQLMLAGPQAEPRRALGAFGGPELLTRVHADADHAIEAAERAMLAELGMDSTASVPLDEALLMAGLSAHQREVLMPLLEPRRLAAGERLFAEGDPGDALYVVAEGSIALVAGVAPPGGAGRPHRFLSASPGLMLGELAVLDRRGRTAAAMAESDALVHRLSADALEALQQAHPDIAAQLLRNIATHLSQRLRVASQAWREQDA